MNERMILSNDARDLRFLIKDAWINRFNQSIVADREISNTIEVNWSSDVTEDFAKLEINDLFENYDAYNKEVGAHLSTWILLDMMEEIPNIDRYVSGFKFIKNDSEYTCEINITINVNDISELGNPEYNGFKLNEKSNGVNYTSTAKYYIIPKTIIDVIEEFDNSDGVKRTIESYNDIMKFGVTMIVERKDDTSISYLVASGIREDDRKDISKFITGIMEFNLNWQRSMTEYSIENDVLVIFK